MGLPKSLKTSPLAGLEMSLRIWGPSSESLLCIEDLPALTQALRLDDPRLWGEAFAQDVISAGVQIVLRAVEQPLREIVAALNVKEVADKIVALGGNPAPMTLDQFSAFIAKEIAINAEIVKASGYQPQ